MNTSSTSEQNRMLPALGGRALLFFMVALAACAIALFFYEYHLEKIRALESLKVSFAERLDALDRCLYVARDHVALMQDWAQTFWGDASRHTHPPALADMLHYNSNGNYFEIPSDKAINLKDPLGNVFGLGRPLEDHPGYVKELNLVAGLMPLLRATVADSGLFFQGYFFSASGISCVYPYLAVADLAGAGNKGANLKALVTGFFEPHRKLFPRAGHGGYWTGVYSDRGRHGLVVTYATPVYSGGRYLGLLGIDVSVDYLRRYVTRFRGLGGRMIMAGHSGEMLIDSASGQDSATVLEASLETRLPGPLKSSSGLIMAGELPPMVPVNGYYVFSKPLKSAPVTFIHILDEKTLRSHLSLTWGTFCAMGLLVVALLLLVYLAVRKRQVEKTLFRSRLRWRDLVDNATVGIYRVFEDGRFIFVNPGMARMFGYASPEQMLKEVPNVVSLYAQPDDRQTNLEKIHRDGRLDGEDVLLRHRDGHLVRGLLSVRRIEDENDICMEGFLIDATERYQAEEALKESEERYRSLVELFPDAVMVHSGLEIVYINDAGARLLGAETPGQIVGRSVLDLIHPDYTDIVKHRLKQVQRRPQPLAPMEQRYIRLNGQAIDVEATGVSITYRGKPAVISVLRDISDRKRAEIERGKMQHHLQQAQKLEAIGTLAGGIAHDFNNLLMGMQGNVSLSLLDVNAGHHCYENLKNIESYIAKASDLTRQILGFARSGKYHTGPLDINRVIEDSVGLFSRTRKEIHVDMQLDADLPTVEADRNQMEQVLINLFVNAWQAMAGGGSIQVVTGSVHLDSDFTGPHETPSGDYVKISVSDDGAGMDPRTMERIFEPFFTTKTMGRGTGLGLASVYGIVKNHGGIITVRSQKGHGTTFDIYLPVSSRPAEEPGKEEKPVSRNFDGRGTVLLVDDEQMILDVGLKLLESMGYRALAASGGREARELYEKHGAGIDLVILDMVMPDMNGARTFEELKKIDPRVKVLLSSGYSLDAKAVEMLNRGCGGFIQKPYDIGQLSSKIREIMACAGDDPS
jgi:PAS domain S-box-containing protein